MSEDNYIHQLEGWLAEVRERSASLLAERNELRKAMRTLGNDYNALSATLEEEKLSKKCAVNILKIERQDARQRAEQAEAELAALKGRRCETCASRDTDACPVWDFLSPADEDEFNEWVTRTPDSFGCNRWVSSDDSL